jgi:hypothetical protein
MNEKLKKPEVSLGNRHPSTGSDPENQRTHDPFYGGSWRNNFNSRR